MIRRLFVLAVVGALPGCAPTGLDGTNGSVAAAEESTAGIADAPPVEAISPANATTITIPGCCRFTVPAGPRYRRRAEYRWTVSVSIGSH